jgi:hypothetical protein
MVSFFVAPPQIDGFMSVLNAIAPDTHVKGEFQVSACVNKSQIRV